jgi:hypothetical protein
MMSRLNGRLKRVEQHTAQSSERKYAELFTDLQRYHEASEAWQEACANGIEGPIPVHPDPGEMTADWLEDSARAGACTIARLRRIIGPVEYLPNMRERAKTNCDLFCGAMFNLDKRGVFLPDRDPGSEFQWPEWKRFATPDY